MSSFVLTACSSSVCTPGATFDGLPAICTPIVLFALSAKKLKPERAKARSGSSVECSDLPWLDTSMFVVSTKVSRRPNVTEPLSALEKPYTALPLLPLVNDPEPVTSDQLPCPVEVDSTSVPTNAVSTVWLALWASIVTFSAWQLMPVPSWTIAKWATPGPPAQLLGSMTVTGVPAPPVE